jgi:hypothetical protein
MFLCTQSKTAIIFVSKSFKNLFRKIDSNSYPANHQVDGGMSELP